MIQSHIVDLKAVIRGRLCCINIELCHLKILVRYLLSTRTFYGLARSVLPEHRIKSVCSE